MSMRSEVRRTCALWIELRIILLRWPEARPSVGHLCQHPASRRSVADAWFVADVDCHLCTLSARSSVDSGALFCRVIPGPDGRSGLLPRPLPEVIID